MVYRASEGDIRVPIEDLNQGFRLGKWSIRPTSGQLEGPDGPTRLRPKSMDVLVRLAAGAGTVVERDQILTDVWGHTVSDEPLTACIAELRRVLGDSRENPTYIQTVPKRGYRLLKELAPLVSEAADAGKAPQPGNNGVAEPTLFSELKNRNILRTSAAYLVGAGFLLFLLSLAGSFINLPAKMLQLSLLVGMLGLPVAIVTAWRFKRSDNKIVRHSASSNSDAIYLASAVLVVLSFAAYTLTEDQESPGSAAPDLRAKSVAVLPFANLSDDAESEYFSDGVAEEVLNLLTKVEGLRVPSRTSSFTFRDSNLDLTAIGERLNVAHVLEGSVRRSGGQVRIVTQLIDVKTDSNLWSHTYERELDNIFVVQVEIARRVVEAMKVSLGVENEERLLIRATDNIRAYDAYLLGLQRLRTGTVQAAHEAVRFFQEAHQLDTTYAEAFAGLAEAYLRLFHETDLPPDKTIGKARNGVRAALKIDPQLAEAHTVNGILAFTDGDYGTAAAAFETAIGLDPKHTPAYEWHGKLLNDMGQTTAAAQLLTIAETADPDSPTIQIAIAQNEAARSDVAAAENRLLELIARLPNYARGYSALGQLYWRSLVRLDDAYEQFERALKIDQDNPFLAVSLAALSMDLDLPNESDRWLKVAESDAPNSALVRVHRAGLELYRGNRPEAARLARQALKSNPKQILALALLTEDPYTAGKFDEAIELIELAYPELTANPDTNVTHANQWTAVRLAFLLQANEQPERAKSLLDSAWTIAKDYPIHGSGFWLNDVRILTLRGEYEAAIAALEKTVNQGWRAYWWWILQHDPVLGELFDRSDFQNILEQIRQESRKLSEKI